MEVFCRFRTLGQLVYWKKIEDNWKSDFNNKRGKTMYLSFGSKSTIQILRAKINLSLYCFFIKIILFYKGNNYRESSVTANYVKLFIHRIKSNRKIFVPKTKIVIPYTNIAKMLILSFKVLCKVYHQCDLCGFNLHLILLYGLSLSEWNLLHYAKIVLCSIIVYSHTSFECPMWKFHSNCIISDKTPGTRTHVL